MSIVLDIVNIAAVHTGTFGTICSPPQATTTP